MLAAFLIVTVENMRQGFRRDSVSRITDFNLRISDPVSCGGIQAQGYFSLFRIFDGIGDQIIEDNGDDFFVKEQKHLFFFYLNLKVDRFLLVEFFVFESDFMNQGRNVAFTNT